MEKDLPSAIINTARLKFLRLKQGENDDFNKTLFSENLGVNSHAIQFRDQELELNLGRPGRGHRVYANREISLELLGIQRQSGADRIGST